MTLKLSRPRILTRAARAGAALYQRERDLKAVMPRLVSRRGGAKTVAALAAAEATCEAERKTGAATYSLEKHIGLLAALLAEARAAAAASAAATASADMEFKVAA